MHLVLDSNEYIFGFGIANEFASRELFQHIRHNPTLINIHICRSIVKEVSRNLSESDAQDFFIFISGLTMVDEDYIVPFELGVKYENYGLKPGDAFIAAYTEYVNAEFLVSENRHFLSRRSHLLFRVINAAECLKVLKS